MKARPFLIPAAASMFFLLPVHAGDKPLGPEKSVTSQMVYDPHNLKRLEPLALKGNARAAMTLFAYYAFYRHPHMPEDDVTARRWLNVAADDGDPDAMLELANIIKGEGGAHNCAKAVALVQKALMLNSDSDFVFRAQRSLEDFKRSPDCAGLI